ncbi:MAG: hypothetical protein ACYC4U_03565 [Pirellulaceae bacterium]
MPNQLPIRVYTWIRRLVVVFVAELSLLAGSYAQVPMRDHVYLPRTRGATALSAQIDAQANMMVAAGDFLEASAIARRHHAAAAEQEITNSVEWVRAYFERKELNRAYRQGNNPTYSQRYEKAQELKAHLLESRPELAMAGDVTDELNFMLDKLFNHTLAHQIVFGDRPPSATDGQLTPDDIHALVLTDGTGKGANDVTFRAERGSPLDFEWPLVFHDEGFKVARRQYELAKKQLLDDSRDGNIAPASWTAIQAAVDGLVSELQRQYPRTRFQDDPKEFLVFNAAMRFLKSKASMVFQARLAADTAYLTDKYIFDGQTVLELVRHMAQNGLRFAPPEEGGDGAYRRLFMMMRQLYLRYYGSDT